MTSDINLGYVRSLNGTYHINLKNWGNTICYAIASFQKLHSSPTLNNLLNSEFTTSSPENTFEYILLRILSEYAKVEQIFNQRGNNFPESDTLINHPDIDEALAPIVHELTNLLQKLSVDFINCNAEGYSPQYFLRYYAFPILFQTFPQQFDKIISEIIVDEVFLSTSLYGYKDEFIGNGGYLQSQHQEQAMKKYQSFIKQHTAPLVQNPNQKTAICIAEVWANATKERGGHAIAIAQSSNGNFYVIDDTECILPFEKYYELKMKTIYEIKFRDVDERFTETLASKTSMKYWSSIRAKTMDNHDKFQKVIINGRAYYEIKPKYKEEHERETKSLNANVSARNSNSIITGGHEHYNASQYEPRLSLSDILTMTMHVVTVVIILLLLIWVTYNYIVPRIEQKKDKLWQHIAPR